LHKLTAPRSIHYPHQPFWKPFTHKFVTMPGSKNTSGIVPARYLWPDGYANFYAWQKKQPRTLNFSPKKYSVSSAEEYYRFVSRPTFSTFSINGITSLFFGASQSEHPECGHKLHPSAAIEAFCPVCQIEHCVAFLEAIRVEWEKVGGPFWKDTEPKSKPAAYGPLKCGWRAARLELWDLVIRLEKQAVLEESMESYVSTAANDGKPNDPFPVVYGAKAALAKYHLTFKYPVSEVSHQSEQEWHSLVSTSKKKKTVHFQEDLVEGKRRKNVYFNRVSHKYAPGRHAPSQGAEFENNTLKNDTEFDLSQCKIFFTDDLSFSQYDKKPEHWLEFEGIAGCHPRWKEILGGLEEFHQWLSVPKRFQWSQRLAQSGTDGVAIVMDGDRIVDFVVLRALKESEEEEIVLKQRTSWVSLSDSLH
jgi:hypothetical protein